MSYPINYPTPQGADVQIFTPNSESVEDNFSATWVKPKGASMVWFTLIGAGGAGGDAITDASGGSSYGGGGGSGAVTNCMVPAFLIPDVLSIRVYPGGTTSSGLDTSVIYQMKNATGYTLLGANGGAGGADASSVGGVIENGTGGTGGAASSAPEFAAAGFYQSKAGQDGSDGNANLSTSTTTFLQGGVGGQGSVAASQYGYTRVSSFGYGLIRPILVSVSSPPAGGTYTTAAAALIAKNGFGCGGGGAYTTTVSTTRYGTRGGDGLAVIVTW